MIHGWRDRAAARLDANELRAKGARERAQEAEENHGRAMCKAPRTVAARARRAGELAEDQARREVESWRRPRPAMVRWQQRATAAGKLVPVRGHTRNARKPKIPAGIDPARLSSTSEQSAKRCEITPLLVSCGCGWDKVDGGCRSSDCVRCADLVASRRAARVRQRFAAGMEGATGRPAHFLTFTVPAELRGAFTDPSTWRALVRGLVAELRREPFGIAWAVEATHPVGDGDGAPILSDDQPPADGVDCSTFHPHANLLAYQDPRGGRRWKLDLDALRAVWCRILAGYGYTGQADDMVRPWCKVFWPKSRRQLEQIRWAHVTRYVLRPFPGWSAWLPSVRWFGRYPRGVVYVCRCGKCSKGYHLIATGEGALTLHRRRLAELGIQPEAPPGTGPPVVFPPLKATWGPAEAAAAVVSLLNRTRARHDSRRRQAVAARRAREAR